MTVTNAIFEASESVIPNAEVPDKPVLLRPLSPRESQIVRLLDQGRTPKEVAFELGIANATVRVLLSRAVKKGGRAPRRA
jgi:DNA-binding NarL/FixJ family response regulator